MNIKKERFGNLADGTEVTRFVLQNGQGLSIEAMDYGANLISVKVPDRDGSPGEVTLGFDDLPAYEGDHPYFGATIGRYANRIADAKFTLKGRTYELYANDGDAHLHGGKAGFDRRMWDAEVEADGARGAVKFHRVSADGEEGYPGALDTTVAFVLTEENELYFEYAAETNAATPVNLTNHTYWNLAGPGSPVYDHFLTIESNQYLAVDDKLLPNGELLQCSGTAFDFSSGKPIGKDIDAAGGYDHCYVLSGDSGALRKAAEVKEPGSGRCMSIETTQPAVQFYTSNMLEDTGGRGGMVYRRHGALCLETGCYNNAVNIPDFPSSVLMPGDSYRHTTRHRFWTE